MVRNRIRRRLRACVALGSAPAGVAVVLSATASSLEVPFQQLRAAVDSVLDAASKAARRGPRPLPGSISGPASASDLGASPGRPASAASPGQSPGAGSGTFRVGAAE